MRKVVFLILIALMILPLAGFAKGGKNGKLMVKPFVFDPDETGLVVSAWMTHVGLPDAGKSNHALYMQKDDVSTAAEYAAAEIRWLEGKDISTLTELGYDYRNDGFCGATSPRFAITIDSVVYTLGCTAGVATPAPDDTVNWTRVRFGPTEFAAAGFPTTGTIGSALIIFDSGTDVGVGNIYLDNIDVNGALIGKPGKNRVPKP